VEINNFLYAGHGEDWVEGAVKSIDNAFEMGGLSDNTLLFRATKIDAKNFRAGSIIEEKGFVSTSTDELVPNYFRENIDHAQIIIRAPKGKKAIHMENVTGSGGEAEIMLPRGSKFRATGQTIKRKISEGGTQTFYVVDLI